MAKKINHRGHRALLFSLCSLCTLWFKTVQGNNKKFLVSCQSCLIIFKIPLDLKWIPSYFNNRVLTLNIRKILIKSHLTSARSSSHYPTSSPWMPQTCSSSVVWSGRIEAVKQSPTVRILLLAFRFKAQIHLPFLQILNYRTASIRKRLNTD